MFGVLNNTVILSGSDVSLPTSRLVLNAGVPQGQLHVNQLDQSLASGILLSGTDSKRFNVVYNGTGLSWYEDSVQKMVLQNGGNLGIGVSNPMANVHIGNDLRVDGNFTVNGSVTTINSISTLTHMLEIENSGTGPAVLIKQTGAMPCMQVYDDNTLALNIADGGFLGINNANPVDWLDIVGSLNATGCLKSAWNYVRSSPALVVGGIGTMSGGYVGWNRTGSSGYTLFANQKGSLTGGWEFVSYTSAGAFNRVSFDIDDSGSFRNFGPFASITGNLYVGSNSFLYGTLTNYGNVVSIGPSNSTSGPQYLAYLNNETSPAYQRSVWAHDNISNNYDAYFDGNNWRFSSVYPAFQIIKSNSNLYIRPSLPTSASAGSLLSWSAAGIDIAATGMVGINTSPSRMLDVGGDVNVQTNLYVLGASTFTGNIVTPTATITGTALNVTGSFASVTGNLGVGTSLVVGSVVSTQFLAVTGSYTSVSGVLSVGTYLAVAGSESITGNLVVGSSTTITGFLTVGSNIAVGSSLVVGTDIRIGGQATIVGNLAVGTSLTVTGFLTVGSNISAGSSLIVGTDLRVGGQATISGNLSVIGTSTVTGNLYVGGQSSLSGNLWVGSSGTIKGNLTIGTSLSVGSIITATALNIAGPYASISGNLWVGTDVVINRNATVLGTLNSVGGVAVGTVQVLDYHGSLLTGVSGSGNISGGTLSASAVQVSAYGSIQGYLSVGTDLTVNRNLSVSQTLTTLNLNCTGQYSSVSGLLVNNVSGSLLLRGYDESGSYKYSTLSAGQSLPAPFLSRPIAASQLSTLNYTGASVGSLASQYSMRITGYIYPPSTGTYTFQMTYKDGLTVWVGPDKLVDSWIYLAASTVTSTNLVMRQGMWTPILIEHANASATEALVIQWALNGSSSYTTLGHATDGSNFQLAYDMYDVPPAVLGTTYVSGKTFFGDEGIFSAGLSLPNANFFSGNVSELANDAGYLQSTPATLSGQAMYVANFASITGTIASYAGSFSSSLFIAGSLTCGTYAKYLGLVDIYSAPSNGQLRISPATLSGEASIGFFRNASRTITAPGDLWLMGNQVNGLTNQNFVLTTGSGSILTVTPTGSIGINQPSPNANLDITGSANVTSNLTVGGNITMTSSPGQGNLAVTNNVAIAGALVVGTTSALANLNLYPGFDNRSSCGTSTARWSNVYSYGLDVVGSMGLTGSLTVGGTNVKQYMPWTVLTVTPSNPDKPVINPDAYNSLLIYEDGSGTALNYGSLSGSAVYGTTSYSSQNCIQLTTTTSNITGSVVWPINPGNTWTLDAETYVGGGNGAEMIAFFVYSSSSSGLGSGYSFVFDEYSNINNGNTSKQFSVNYNGSPLTSVNGTVAGGSFLIPLAVWNRLRIVFFRNNIRMYLNNNLVINFKDTNRIISGPNTYYCGFYGQCTTNNNFHAVRNVRLNKTASGGWDWVNQTSSDICFPAGNVGINQIVPMYSLDVTGTGRLSSYLSVNNAVQTAALNVTPLSGSMTSPDSLGIYIFNPTNSAGNRSSCCVRTGGSSANSPFFSMDVYNVAGWSMGNDNLDSNKFKIRQDWNFQANDRLVISNTGNVGINTSSPSLQLDVVGTIRGQSTAATSTSNPQLIAQVGTSSVNVIANAGLGNFNSLTNAGDSLMYFNNGGVGTGSMVIGPWSPNPYGLRLTAAGYNGINTASPSYNLDIGGSTSQFSSTLRLGTTTFAGSKRAAIDFANGSSGWQLGTDFLSNGTMDLFTFNYANNTTPLYLHASGTMVGVNQTGPAYSLDVTGTGRFTTGVIIENNQSYNAKTASGIVTYVLNVDTSNNLRLHTPGGGMYLNNDVTGPTYIGYNNAGTVSTYNGTNVITSVNATGLGIFNSSPTYALDVAGTGRLSSYLSVNNAVQTAALNVLPLSGSMTTPNSLGLYIYNPTNAPGNRSSCCVRTGGSSANSPFFSMDVSGVTGWSLGNDNLDSNKFKIRQDWNFVNNDRFVITLGGNVGINTSNPVYFLDVNGTLRFTGTAYANVGANNTALLTDNGAIIAAKNSSGTTEQFLWPRWTDNVTYLNYGSAGFNVRNNSGSPAMFINNSLQVGINTTSPSYSLDVAGTQRVSGAVDNVLNITSTASSGNNGYSHAITTLNGNLASNEVNLVQVGLAASTNNLAYFGFCNVSSGSSSNYATIGIYAADRIFNITASKNVGINTTTPSYSLDVSGTIRATGDVISNSDARLKTNIQPLTDSLQKVCKLRGVSFEKEGTTGIGLIAQEVKEVIPEVVKTAGVDDIQAVAYGNLVGHLVEAVKTLKAEIESLKSQVQ